MSVRKIAAAVVAGVLALGLVGCATAGAAPDPMAERRAEVARVDGVYLEQVRLHVPALADVSDARLVEAAQFVCAAHGDLTDPAKGAADLGRATVDLVRYGYVPRQAGAYEYARQVAGLTGITCI